MTDTLVKAVSFEVRVNIYRYTDDGGEVCYYWTSSNGDESDENFLYEEDAETDARIHFV
jgi:hypothetical protein